MKYHLYILLFLCILTIFFNVKWYRHDNINMYLSDVQHNVHPFDRNGSNSLFFLSSISGKRCIVLGEQTHFDGPTLALKKEIIKYLHEKAGYNVVLYEAGMYDMWQMVNQERIKPALGLFPFWWENKESEELWDYYEKCSKKHNPILLGGFDIQFTGNMCDSTRINKLIDYLNRKKIKPSEYAFLLDLKDEFSYYFLHSFISKQLDKDQANQLFSYFDKLADLIQIHNNGSMLDTVYYKYIRGLRFYLESCYRYEAGEPQRMQLRDSLMCDNIIWLADNVYEKEKIIVWCSNLHAMYGGDVNFNQSQQFISMGSRLKQYFGDDMASVVFTSYGRLDDKSRMVNKLSNKSLEYYINLCGISQGYLNFNEVSSTSFLKGKFVSGVNQGLCFKEPWSEKIDILIYLDSISEPKPI